MGRAMAASVTSTATALPGRRSGRLIVALLVVTALAMACGGPPSVAQNDAPREGDVLRVGIGVSPPFTIRRTDGSYEGFDIDMLQLLAAEKGLRLELVDSSYTTIIAGLQARRYDMITSLQAREERRRAVDFAAPMLSMGGAWLVPRSRADLATVASLDQPSVTIACLAGGAQCLISRSVTPRAQLREVPSAGAGIGELVSEVISGRSDVLAVEELITPALTQVYPDLRVVTDGPDGIAPVDVSWSVAKGDSGLLSMLNDFVQRKKADGTVRSLLDKWVTPESILKN